MGPQRRSLILRAEQAAPLQFRDDQGHEIVHAMRELRGT